MESISKVSETVTSGSGVATDPSSSSLDLRQVNLPQLRIVLLGKTGAGKSATGNTILDRDAFKNEYCPNAVTKTCQKAVIELDGKECSVIDTPGLFDTSISNEELNIEIQKCIYMSAPGPHVFLLVIRLDVRVTEEEKNTVKWIQNNFGEDAARYTIILFTHADVLKGKTLDDFVRTNNDLQVLVANCGGRHQSFNNDINEGVEKLSQVTQLLEKIEKMVKKNGGNHYTNDMYQKAQREMEIEKFWSMKPRFVLLGKRGSGKTATRKNILRIDCNLPNSATKTCEKHEANVNGKNIKIIDTPEQFDTSEEKLKSEIEKLLGKSSTFVFLLVIRLNDKSTVEHIVKWIQKSFGEDALKYTIILFTHADVLKVETLNEHLAKNPDLKALTDSFKGRYNLLNNKDLENHSQVTELLLKIEEMVLDNRGEHYTYEMFKEAQRKIEIENFWSMKPRIVLLGKSGSAKTAIRKTILKQDCDSSNSATITCEQHEANANGKNIIIIDTPLLFDISMSEEKMKSEIEKCVYMSAPGPHVFLLVIRLDVLFIDEGKNTVKWIQENFGEDVAQYIIILFTHEDQLKTKSLNEYIKESSDLHILIDSCGGRYFSFNEDRQDQVSELLDRIEKLAESNKWKYYRNNKFKEIIERQIQNEKTLAALTTAPGLAAVVGGTVALAVTETIIVPAAAVAGSLGAIGAAGAFAVKKFREWSAKRD